MMPSVVESGDVGKGHCLQRSASDASSGYADVFISCGREGLFLFEMKKMHRAQPPPVHDVARVGGEA